MTAFINDQLVIPSYNKKISEIIESGSNENGSWIKFADGTMLQDMYVNLPEGKGIATTTYGSWNLGAYTWKFPVEFANTELPRVVCSLFKWQTGASYGYSNEPSYTQVVLRGVDAVARDVNSKVAISAIAKGRWK